MTYLDSALRLISENKATLTVGSTIVFTAFLFNSPEPKPDQWFYAWVRKSLFTIFNREHPVSPKG